MKLSFLITAFLFLSTVHAHAVELTLEDCLSAALQNNGGLKALEMSVLSSEEESRMAEKSFFPSLKFHGDYTLLDRSDVFIFQRNVFAPGIPPADVEVSARNRDMYGASLSIEQPLYTGGQLTHSLLKSRIMNAEARQMSKRQKDILTFEVKKAFFEALKEQLYRKIFENVVETKKERLRVLRERHLEGYVGKEDILLAEADLSASELESYKAKNREGLALSRVKRFIYYQGDEEIFLKGAPTNGSFVASLQEVQGAALNNREDLKASSGRIKAAEEDIGAAKSGFYPKASLQGRYTMQKETTVTRPEVWMLTAQIDWNIFDWNKTKSEVRKHEALMQRRKYEHEELARAVLLEVEENWRSVKEKGKEVETKEKRLKTAEYRLRMAMERYAEETIKLADLLEIETEMIRTHNEYMVGLADLDIALALIESTASVPDQKWFSPAETYLSDAGSLSAALKELITGKKEKKTKNEPSKNNHDSPSDRPVPSTKLSEGPPGELQTKDHNSRIEPVVVQIASVKTKKYAEKLRKDLLNKIGDKRIRIDNQGKFYKVRLAGFKDREEARELLAALGLKGYLFIKASHEF